MSDLNEQQIKSKFLEMFIVPNFYKPEHLEMDEWSESKVERFKEFLKDADWFHDRMCENLNSVIEDFKNEDEDTESEKSESEVSDENQDDFEERMCENCDKEFTLKDPHYYDEENAVCYCNEECYKADQEIPDPPKLVRQNATEGSVRRRRTPEEEAERNKNNPDCVLCGNKCDCPYGNNPYPLATDGVCCGTCNTKVIMARLGFLEMDYEEDDEETCDKCGKREGECDVFPRGDNITNYATTGEMLCPDCIPEEEVEGVCFECKKEGKFIGEEGDDWLCEDCSSL